MFFNNFVNVLSFCLLSPYPLVLKMLLLLRFRLTTAPAIAVGKGAHTDLLLLMENLVNVEIIETNSNLTTADFLFKCPISE